jgi:hypothetical protein
LQPFKNIEQAISAQNDAFLLHYCCIAATFFSYPIGSIHGTTLKSGNLIIHHKAKPQDSCEGIVRILISFAKGWNL